MKHLITKSQKKFNRVMHEFGQGELKSHDKSVTDKRQALAIAFSEARKVYPNYGIMNEGGIAGQGDIVKWKNREGDYVVGGIYKDTATITKIGHLNDPEYKGSYKADLKDLTIIQKETRRYEEGGTTPARAAELARIYEKGTSRQLWDFWNTNERTHFLLDHAVEFFELMGNDFNKSSGSYSILSYNTLPSPIKKSLIIHHAQGLYKQGGPIYAGGGGIEKTDKELISDFKDFLKTKFKMENPPVSISNGELIIEFQDQYLSDPDSSIKLLNALKKFAKNYPMLSRDKYDDREDMYFKIDRQQKKHGGIMNNGGPIPKKLSPAKKKLHNRITTLKGTMANAGAAAQKSIQKKIDVLQKQFDHNPSAKERAQDNKGKFAMDVPEKYSKYIYKKLWSMDIRPAILKLNGTSSIVVSSKINLEKAYKIYSDKLKEEKEQIPSLSKISRKL